MSEEDTKREKVISMTTRNFSITKCPERVYEDFVGFCREETNENYSMGLKLLMDARKVNIKEALLFEQYMEVKAELRELRESMVPAPEEKEPVKKVPTTFGRKKK